MFSLARQTENGFERITDVRDVLGRPPIEILTFLAKLRTQREVEKLEDQIMRHLQVFEKNPRSRIKYQYPGKDKDLLFTPDYTHQVLWKTCQEIRCDRSNLVTRQRLLPEEAANPTPAVHIGLYASGNRVMKSATQRDEIARREGVIAFEMEGAGAWESFPCVIIKSACDYADSHKSMMWQEYAAAVAASCTKGFLHAWSPPGSW